MKEVYRRLICGYHVERPDVEHDWECDLPPGHDGPHREVVEYVVWWDDDGNEVRPPTRGKAVE